MIDGFKFSSPSTCFLVIVTFIIFQFGLSQTLAERYATLVFAASFRFEMSKRKLNYLNFDDVIVPISLVLIENWIDCGASSETMSTAASVFGEGLDTEKMNEPPTLDKDFLTSLRDLKVQLDVLEDIMKYQYENL